MEQQNDIAFKYYQEQWAHVRHHETLRSALTFQILAGAVGVGVGYVKLGPSDTSHPLLQSILGGIAVALGTLGWVGVARIEQAASIHIQRARAARKSIGLLEPFVSTGGSFPQLKPIYLAFNGIVVVLGLSLMLLPWIKDPKAQPEGNPSKGQSAASSQSSDN